VLLRSPEDGPQRRQQEARAQELLAAGVRPCVPELVNSIGMRLALIPPGSFLMGSPAGERIYNPEETPRHPVEITRAFYLGVFPVTQAQYARVMGVNPSRFTRHGGGAGAVVGLDTRTFPVESVSYDDAAAFCRRLSDWPPERRAGRSYRLPSEAEWEYACRAGVWSTPFHFGRTLLRGHANYHGSLRRGDRQCSCQTRPTPVGSYRPNAWGLYDLHGNVWEWCSDWYGGGFYHTSPAEDPTGPACGHRRVLRGGGWGTPADLCRCAVRGHNARDARCDCNGFRVTLTAEAA
jgi:formylglycine-generating enzyme required for sulfatase activity